MVDYQKEMASAFEKTIPQQKEDEAVRNDTEDAYKGRPNRGRGGSRGGAGHKNERNADQVEEGN